MAVTEAALQAAIQAKGYGTDSATAQVEAIKSAWRRVLGLRRWPFLEATATTTATVGSETVSLAAITDLARVEAVRLTIGTEGYGDLTFVERGRLRNWLASDRDQATPDAWTFHAGAVLLYPRPERAYTVTIDYKKRPAYNGSDIVFPEGYEDVLVWGAITELSFRQRELNGYADAQFKDRLSEMIDDYGLEQRQGSREVGHSSVWYEVRT